ncbi:MAG: hypothetical protein AB7F50_04625 [Fimbriimonadaceae bacterium]
MDPARAYPPSYFPEPIEVPENAAQGPYLPRVAFVRSVVALHSLTIAATAAFATWGTVPALPGSLALFLGALIVLSAERRLLRNSQLTRLLSPAILVIGLYGLSGLARPLEDAGLPLEGIAISAAAALTYVSVCGKAFSYLGLGFLSMVASSTCLVFLSQGREPGWLASGIVITAAWILYLCYDLSMVVKRRRINEVAPAVADLYRDLLNFALYPGRVWLHWKRYKFL